jgi:polygalacturonase
MQYDIVAYGAVGDGETLNTRAIQAAIDAASRSGGGTVLLAGGVFRTGTLRLADSVGLEIAAGAVLRGSAEIGDYPDGCGRNMYRGEPEMDPCLIFAEGASNIGIRGLGTIDGDGSRETFPNPDDPRRRRPMLIRCIRCAGIRVRDVTLRDPAAWTSAWLYCDDVVVDGVTIHSRANDNGDGLDFDGCTRVRVANCTFSTSDDSICLQTSRADRPCRDVVVTNCTFSSKWAGLRIGLLSRGDFDGVCLTNCTFRDIRDAGLKIQVCEGAAMRNMSFTNLVMSNVPRPIFMTLGRQRCCVDAPEGLPPYGSIRRLRFSHITVDNTQIGLDSHMVLTGVPDAPLEDVTLSEIHMISRGGASEDLAAGPPVPELTPENLHGHWPEYHCFGRPLPAGGLYARHIRRLACRNLRFTTSLPDARPAIVTDDVTFPGDHPHA